MNTSFNINDITTYKNISNIELFSILSSVLLKTYRIKDNCDSDHIFSTTKKYMIKK
jgi:hypothetical protein